MIPDLSVLWVIAFVLLLAGVANQLLFKPIVRVMREREDAIRSAREMAEQAAVKTRAAAEEFETRTQAARAEVYRQMDEMRRLALERRTEMLARTREDIEAQIVDASARLNMQAERARATLTAAVEDLGNAIVERVLGRKAS